MNIERFLIAFSAWLPLFVFLLYARVHTWFFELTDDVWRQAFYVSSICAIITTAFLIYKKVIIDRLRLGINIFLLTGSFLFLIDSETLLRFFEEYKGVPFFSGIIVIGIITTFFSSSGFIGIVSTHKKKLQKASFVLLGAVIIALTWSFVMNNYGTIVAVVVPFIALRLLRKSLIDRLLIDEKKNKQIIQE